MSDGPEGQIPELVIQPDDASVLRAVIEGTATTTGEAFFQSLARHLADATGTRFAFVAEFLPPGLARTLAFWARDHIADNVEWDLSGTPCEEVIHGELCHHPTGVSTRFPTDRPLVDLGVESYLGVPLRDASGETLGHLAVLDDRPMPSEPRRLAAFRIFAARAAAELQRLRVEHQLRARERSYRDLYEEAPIAYIYEDLESRFVRANLAACTLLGLKPDEVVGTLGKSLLAPTPETAKQVEQLLRAMKTKGEEFSRVELEMRRKDNGQPVWVQWWSRPEPDGKHTRTMLVDVTERVLMAREKARLERQNVYLQEETRKRVDGPLLGDSPAISRLREEIAALAASSETVLLTGPAGAGQEAVARAIHHGSKRGKTSFVYLNYALQSGAQGSVGSSGGKERANLALEEGKFELARGGTIYLEGIDRLPLQVQQQVVEVIEESVPGESDERPKFDVRIIASTSHNIDEIQESRIAPDLYRVLVKRQLRVPALAERREDIPDLVEYFVTQQAQAIGKVVERVSDKSLERLQEYRWPGNVRELQNVLERVVVSASGPVVEVNEALLDEGIRMGSYHLVERLSAGGMGDVWLAKHKLLARPAAVKLIRQETLERGESDEAF